MVGGSGLGAVCKCVSTARGFWRGMEGNNSFVMNLPDFLESRTELVPGLGRCPGEGNGNQSSILVWIIPWTEEPGGLQPMGSQSRIQVSD